MQDTAHQVNSVLTILETKMSKKKHGHAVKGQTREYSTWHSMKQRCFNSKNPYYPRYGGRGITICDRWLKFEKFLEDMGLRPAGRTLDRINNDGNYEPGNCRWATHKEQCRNRVSNRVLTLKGKAKKIIGKG